jgi:hypothetical protein
MGELLRGRLLQLEVVRLSELDHLLHMREAQPVAQALAQFFAMHLLTCLIR